MSTAASERICPAIRWAVGLEDDRACGLAADHAGDHDFVVKPRAGSAGWEDQ